MTNLAVQLNEYKMKHDISVVQWAIKIYRSIIISLACLWNWYGFLAIFIGVKKYYEYPSFGQPSI